MNLVSVVLTIFTCTFFSCGMKPSPRVFSTDNLKSTFVQVSPDSGYHIRTSKGALIEISPNTFNVAPGTKVTVEIKEAYSMQDILLAGLSTQSNGKPLRSAGMLYFKAIANGQNVEFLKAVKATIPGNAYDSSMQVFRAEISKDSSINWVNPQPVDTSPYVKELAIGRALFISNCATCHHPLSAGTGPALAGARMRSPNYAWPYRFVNNTRLMSKQDPYARRLVAKYGLFMTEFHLPVEGIKAILDYCDNDALLNSSKKTDSTIAAATPCGYDTVYYSKPTTNMEVLAENETSNTTDSASDSDYSSFDGNSSPLPVDDAEAEFSKKGFKNIIPSQGLYKFNLESSGWYNIDVLFKEPNATPVQLFAKIEGSFQKDMNLYLCIPKRNIVIEARRHNGNVYLFDYSDADGFMKMVLGDGAFIIATASVDEKVYYGITKFAIQKKQTIGIHVKKSNREQILHAIAGNQLDGLKLDLEEQERAIIERPCYDQIRPVSDSSIVAIQIDK